MIDLAGDFNNKCNTIEEYSTTFEQDISQEQVEVQNKGSDTPEIFSIGEYMNVFETGYNTCKDTLAKLWDDYETVQKQIMELALVICGDNTVLISLEEGQDPGLDEDAICDRRAEWTEAHDEASHEFDELADKVETYAEQTLTENVEILQVRSI